MEFAGRRAVVLGLGLTGYTLARHLAARGASVRVADTRDAPPELARLRATLPQVAFLPGTFHDATFAGADLIAISPGVPRHQAPIAAAVAAGVELVGDIELFARALPAGQKVLAITGSNGKSTVTALASALCRAAGLATVVAGNIGEAVLSVIPEAGGTWPDVFVLELSSFQLETTASLAPVAAAVLNVTPNHLDRYEGIADYAAAKARIYARAAAQVINRDDAIVRLMRLPGHTVQTFGGGVPESEEAWGLVAHGGNAEDVWLARGGALVFPARDLTLVGAHNVRNALAALALTSAVAKIDRAVLAALARFEGLPHRMQIIADEDGVLYVDDSKGTTVTATEAALAGLGRPVVLIAGGDGKGQSFRPLRAPVDAHCRAVVLIGRDGSRIGDALAGSDVPVVEAGTLDAAVERAMAFARRGDAVLLSPACASLDQFANYIERGERFAARVQSLIREATPHG